MKVLINVTCPNWSRLITFCSFMKMAKHFCRCPLFSSQLFYEVYSLFSSWCFPFSLLHRLLVFNLPLEHLGFLLSFWEQELLRWLLRWYLDSSPARNHFLQNLNFQNMWLLRCCILAIVYPNLVGSDVVKLMTFF